MIQQKRGLLISIWEGDKLMDKLSLKCKILFILFAVCFIISDILFNFEQMILAIISFIIAIIFAVLLTIEYKKNSNKNLK